MPMSGPNPVLAPIRRWVLYSRTHLAITVAGTIAALFAVGTVVGEDPPPPRATTQEASNITAEEAIDAAETVTYDLDEVSESLVAAKSATWASSTAPATAMAYAHTFVDTIPSDAMWAAKIGRYTNAEPGTAFLAARPRKPVVITGPTASTLSAGPEGTRVAKVSVPTQAGSLQISLRIDSTAGQRWVVDTPLPTLELAELDKIADAGSSTAPTTTSGINPVPTTTNTAPTSTLPQPTFDLDEPTSELQEPTVPSVDAGPVPVPGPIPIPELDTPIPGER